MAQPVELLEQLLKDKDTVHLPALLSFLTDNKLDFSLQNEPQRPQNATSRQGRKRRSPQSSPCTHPGCLQSPPREEQQTLRSGNAQAMLLQEKALPLLGQEIKKKRKREEELEEIDSAFEKEIHLDGAVPIKKLVETAKRGRVDFHPLLPEIWFFMVCIGPSECGKTTVLLNLLKNKDAYKGKFDRIFMFNPYANPNPNYNKTPILHKRML